MQRATIFGAMANPPDLLIKFSVQNAAEWLDEHEPLLGVNGPHVIYLRHPSSHLQSAHRQFPRMQKETELQS